MSVGALVAIGTKSYQILDCVIAQSGSAAECDGPEDLPFARTVGNATHLAPELSGKVGDKPLAQASSVVVLRGSQSQRHVMVFKKLLPLQLRKIIKGHRGKVA